MTHRPRLTAGPVLGVGLWILLILPSCGGPSMNPSADRARTALDAALNAWKDGKKSGLIEGTDPPVQAIDSDWTNGRSLASFEVVGETRSEADKRFQVKLTYQKPAATAETTYIVVGASPIAVFREDDYARTLNMDNNPTPKRKR